MRLRIGLRRLWLLLIALCALAPHASADIGQSLGFERPLLVGDLAAARSIDIGADGRTDLLIRAFGVLNGSEPLDGRWTLLIQQPDGGWSRREQLLDFGPGAVTDLDQDGREDLVTGGRDQVICWRQTAAGLLGEAGADTIPSGWSNGNDPQILPMGGGRVLWLSSSGYSDTPVRAILFRWAEPGDGLRLAWADTIPNSDFNRCAMAAASGVSYLIGEKSSPIRLWAASAADSGHGATVFSRPLDALGTFDLVPVGRDDQGRVLLWPRSQGDVYYDVIPGPDSISLRPGRVPGMPKLTRSGYRAALSRADGTTTIAFPRVDSLGHCIAYVQIDGSLPPRHLANARIEDSDLEAVVDAPGRIEVLASTSYGGNITSSEPSSIRDPDVPCQISGGIAMDDMNGDGIPDLIFIGWSPGAGFQLIIARGIDQAPWFAAPEPVPITEDLNYLSVGVGDLDGDGKRDLLLIRRSSDSDSCEFHPYFQAEGAFQAGPPVFIPDVQSASASGIGDFDGDGRAEVSYQINLFGGAVRLLRWNRDRSVDATVGDVGELHGEPVATGDFDGDGKDEVVVSSSGMILLSIDRLYPVERTYQVFTDSGFPTNAGYQWVGDMNGDGRAELYVEGTTGSLFAFSPDGTVHTLCQDVPRIRGWFTSYLHTCVIDIDGDGLPELVSTAGNDRSIEITDDVTVPGTEPIVWVAPDGRNAASDAYLFWRDVDHDGDPDPIFLCRDGIRVGRNDAIGPAPTRSQDGMLRLVSRTPAGTSARVAVRIARPGPITLHLYDVAGRAIWGERRDSAPANEWVEFVVAPKPAEGAIARGVYFLKVVGGGHAATRRILLGF